MDEAIALDGGGGVVGGGAGGSNGGAGVATRLAGAVREELNAALVAFGEPPLAARASNAGDQL